MIKTYANNVMITLENLTTIGALTGVRTPVAKAPKMCTPDGHAVRQVYQSVFDGKLFERDELSRALEIIQDGNKILVPFDADEEKEAKESKLELNVLNLTIHDRADIEANLFPDKGNGYIFTPVRKTIKNKVIPDPENVHRSNCINAMLRDNPDIALIGKCNLQHHEGLFRVTLFKGRLCMTKQLSPEEVNNYEFETPDIDEKTLGMLRQVSEKLRKPFDPVDYENQIAQRVFEVRNNAVEPKEITEADKVESSVMDLLMGMVSS